jgi:predicted ribosomally synthesized peptide with SipW-like signal peptide
VNGPQTKTIATKVALTAGVLALIGALAGLATWSAFSATTENPDNTFSTGTVVLTDDDQGSAMFTMTNAKPGDSASSCIVVSYSGTLPSTVRLYGTTSGTGLDQYLNLQVVRGTKSSTFPSCADFIADGTNYTGAGPGVVYNGTLQGYPDDYASGIVDPTAGSPESWTNPESHAYQFVVTVQDDDDAQGKSANQAFTWEARNS